MEFRTTALASLMALVCTLSACGGGSDSEAGNSSNTNSTNAASVANWTRHRNGSSTTNSTSTTTSPSTATSPSTSTSTPASTTTASSTLSSRWLANYCGEPGNSQFPSEQASYQNVMGKAPSGWLTYLAANYTPDDPSFGWVAASRYFATMGKENTPTNNAIPVIGLPMGYSASGNGPGGNLFAAIAAGTYDSALQGSVQAWAQGGYKTLYYRPGWEFNGNWYPWSIQNATDLNNFIAAFRHIYTVLHTAAATYGVTVNVVWNPNVGGNQAGGTSTWNNWYPGNSYVDVIGIDNYGAPVDRTDPPNAPGSATSYTPLQAIAFAKANGKPFSIPETGGDNSDGFITALGSVISQANVTWSFIGLWNDYTGGGNVFSSSASLGSTYKQVFAN